MAAAADRALQLSAAPLPAAAATATAVATMPSAPIPVPSAPPAVASAAAAAPPLGTSPAAGTEASSGPSALGKFRRALSSNFFQAQSKASDGKTGAADASGTANEAIAAGPAQVCAAYTSRAVVRDGVSAVRRESTVDVLATSPAVSSSLSAIGSLRGTRVHRGVCAYCPCQRNAKPMLVARWPRRVLCRGVAVRRLGQGRPRQRCRRAGQSAGHDQCAERVVFRTTGGGGSCGRTAVCLRSRRIVLHGRRSGSLDPSSTLCGVTTDRRRYAPPPPETFVQLVLRHYAAAVATAPAPSATASAIEEDLENEHFRLADAFLSAIEECGQAQSCHVPSLTFTLPPRGDEEPAMLPIAIAQAHADGSAGAHSDRTHSVDTDEDEDGLRAYRRRIKGKHSRKSSSLSQSGTATRVSCRDSGRHPWRRLMVGCYGVGAHLGVPRTQLPVRAFIARACRRPRQRTLPWRRRRRRRFPPRIPWMRPQQQQRGRCASCRWPSGGHVGSPPPPPPQARRSIVRPRL